MWEEEENLKIIFGFLFWMVSECGVIYRNVSEKKGGRYRGLVGLYECECVCVVI